MIDFNDAGSQEDFYFIDEPVSSQSYHSFTFDRGALAGAIFEDIPSANITPEMVIPDGNFHRFSTDGTGKDRDGYIKTFADGLGAIYGCNRTGIKGVYQAWKPTTPQEKAEWDEKVKRGQEEAAQKLEQERAECRRKSLYIWNNGKSADPNHVYLVRQKIPDAATVIRQDKHGNILIPVRDHDETLHGLQFIPPEEGKKKNFLTGTNKKGHFFIIGEITGAKVILFAEGFATAWTIHKAAGLPVVVCFDADNIKPVVESFHRITPDVKKVICADDDFKRKNEQTGKPENIGVLRANEAARPVNGLVVIPSFSGERGDKDTDFNDLMKLEGIEAVKIQVEKVITSEPVDIYSELMEQAKALTPEDAGKIEDIVKRATCLSPIEKQFVFKEIKKQTKTTLESLRLFERAENKDSLPDHLELARRVIGGIGRENILSTNIAVYIWDNDGVWKKAEDMALRQLAQGVLEGCGDVTKSLVDGVIGVLKAEIYKPENEFNIGDPEVVNCMNGELHLDGSVWQWILKPHHRESFRTSQIPVFYDPEATAPRFLQFLDEIFALDSDGFDKQQALLEMIGYTLVAHCRHEKFIILVGVGANGKSVLLFILESLCGVKNVAGVQPSQLDNKFQRAHLHGRLANIVTEIKQGEVIADAALKSIVSGELVTVEHKNQTPFEMRPFATCWFGTNHMPHTRDFSEALFRRALIITFNRVFKAGKDADPNLKDRLLKELPGIFNLSITAYAKALKNGFTMPASSMTAKDEWIKEADQAAQFIDDACLPDEFGRVQTSVLYSKYKAWANDNGIHQHLTSKSFSNRLIRLGYGRDRDRQNRYITGLVFRE